MCLRPINVHDVSTVWNVHACNAAVRIVNSLSFNGNEGRCATKEHTKFPDHKERTCNSNLASPFETTMLHS